MLHERRLATERISIPARPIRAFAAEAAEDLERSLAQIESWMGRQFAIDSRPRAAIAVLWGVSKTGQFTPEQRGDELAIRALQIALDFKAIAQSLPSQRVADLRKDVEESADGPLDPPPGELRPLQAQSQLVVRAAFALKGVTPTQPTHSGSGGRKKPDILVENGISNYAVEVKRPTALKNVVPRALDAANQLRGANMKGGIVVDITDCSGNTPQEADDNVLAQSEALAAQFFRHGQGWRPNMSHVMMVLVMARPAWRTVMTGAAEGQVLIHSTSAGQAFGTARGTLDDIRARWLRTILSEGLNLLGFTSEEESNVVRSDEEL